MIVDGVSRIIDFVLPALMLISTFWLWAYLSTPLGVSLAIALRLISILLGGEDVASSSSGVFKDVAPLVSMPAITDCR